MKGNDDLGLWSASVKNQFWFCAWNCGGNVDKFKIYSSHAQSSNIYLLAFKVKYLSNIPSHLFCSISGFHCFIMSILGLCMIQRQIVDVLMNHLMRRNERSHG